jgi:hypothetical protein
MRRQINFDGDRKAAAIECWPTSGVDDTCSYAVLTRDAPPLARHKSKASIAALLK